MTDPDYRAMCAELTDAELANAARKALGEPSYATELHYFLSEDSNEYEPLMLAIRAGIAADRARALLAQPEPVAPTDQEIEEWADACPEAPLEEMDPEIHGWRRCFTAKEFGETIRAALVRWGHQ